MSGNGYWDKFWRRKSSRRALLRGSAVGAAGLAAAIALGCEEEEEAPVATATPTPGTPTVATATPAATATLGPEFANAKRGGVLNRDKPDEPIDLNPHVNEIPGSVEAIAIAYNHLMRRWENWEKEPGKVFIGPELASEWEQIDELTYRFSLVKNAKWHNLPPVNGRQLTAADVKYSFERMIDPTNMELRTRSSLEAIDTIETPDDFTVVFKTKFPFAAFINNAGHTWAVICPPELAETEEIKQRSVGTRFIFKGWQRGVKLEWERNPEYFLPNMFVDKVIMRVQPDPASRLANFRTGETDFWGGYPPSTPIDVIEDVFNSVPDLKRVEYEAVAGYLLKTAMDTASEPFKDIRLRQAILYGINYGAIKKMFEGYASRTGPIATGNAEWALAVEDLPPYDPEKAKALLAEAGGYGPDNPLKVKTQQSKMYAGATVAQVVQALLKPVGIQVEIEMMENAEWIAKIYRGTQSYQMSSHADWAFEDPDRGLYTYFHSKGAANQTHYSNPEVDRLLEAQRREFDLEKRKALVREIQLKIVNDAPQVYLATPGYIMLIQPWIHNFSYMPQGNANYYRAWDNVWYDPIPKGRS